jgi:hypothetical protein
MSNCANTDDKTWTITTGQTAMSVPEMGGVMLITLFWGFKGRILEHHQWVHVIVRSCKPCKNCKFRVNTEDNCQKCYMTIPTEHSPYIPISDLDIVNFHQSGSPKDTSRGHRFASNQGLKAAGIQGLVPDLNLFFKWQYMKLWEELIACFHLMKHPTGGGGVFSAVYSTVT